VDCFIGVDSGGTETSFAAAERSGKIIGTLTSVGGSYKEIGIEKAVGSLYDNVTRCLAEAGAALSDLSGVCFGLPCVGESAKGDRELTAAVKERFAHIPVIVLNDSEVGWAGSLAMQPGINIVSGTGSIGFGRDLSGNSARCGGWSEVFSDEGSCFWLGRRTMELFSKQADGRLPKGPLYGLISTAFSLSEDFAFIDVMENDYLPHRDKVASMQLFLEQAARQGDGYARDLYAQAADELASIVAGVAARLKLEKPFPVSYSGGLFKAGDLIMRPFSERVSSLGGSLREPLLSPTLGAVLLAFSEFSGEPLDGKVRELSRKGKA